jgi:hypothetical protein
VSNLNSSSPAAPNPPPGVVRTIVDILLALHIVGAAAYWWLSPKGFPVDSSRFWLNSVSPFVMMAAAAFGLVALHRRRWPSAAAVVCCFSVLWLAGGVSARVFFPMSLRIIWVLPVFVSIIGFALAIPFITRLPRSWTRLLAGTTLGGFLGVFFVWAQAPLPPGTKPMDVSVPPLVNSETPAVVAAELANGARYSFNPAARQLTLTVGELRIDYAPFLEFDRVTADGFWSLLGRRLDAQRLPVRQSNESGQHSVLYSDDAALVIRDSMDQKSMRTTAFTPLSADTYSHLNTFCYFEIDGHERLELSFSPCPNERIEVLPSDYPVGRPARVAYVDEAAGFHVVEARSGEKGPFRSLAAGKLNRDDSLTITIHDNGRAVASLTLADWSRQASTQLSPSAGWGLPVNAIEFRRLGDNPRSSVAIWVTLAGTAIGRGWEAVGYRAGTYRNEVVFQAE